VPQSCGTCQSRHTGLQQVALAYYQELKYMTRITSRTKTFLMTQEKEGSPHLRKYTIPFPIILTDGWVYSFGMKVVKSLKLPSSYENSM